MLEHPQGLHSYNFSGKPVPVPYHVYCKEFLPNIYFKPVVLCLRLCPITTCPCVKSLSSILVKPLYVLKAAIKAP